jgi:N-acetylneuraminate lyase
MNLQPLHELVVATHSPFHADGSLAPEFVPTQAAFLAANGIRTVFITGSTGESHSLTCAERLALYDAWAIAAPEHGLRVIAHVGSNCLEDAKTLARRAEKLGFAAISALAPSYYKPGSLAGFSPSPFPVFSQASPTPSRSQPRRRFPRRKSSTSTCSWASRTWSAATGRAWTLSRKTRASFR